MAQNNQELVIYKSKDGTIELKAKLEQETIWLDAHQMAELFGRDRTVILRHLRNVYSTGELDQKATCAKIAQVASDGKTRQMDIFNLDAIISVGYRVNSKRGTEFRIWATNVLKQHIVQGYTVNEKRLKQLGRVVKLASDISKRKQLSGDEASILLQIVSEYAAALNLLDDYDHQRVAIGKTCFARQTRHVISCRTSRASKASFQGVGLDEWNSALYSLPLFV